MLIIPTTKTWPVTDRLTLCVSDRWTAADTAVAIGATHVVSISDPGEAPVLFELAAERVLRLMFEDVKARPSFGAPVMAPHKRDVKRAVDFVQAALADAPAVVLVHCHGGVSRSAGMALAIAASVSDAPGADLLDGLLAARPVAEPNPLVLEEADSLLRRQRDPDLAEALAARKTTATPAEAVFRAGVARFR